MKIRKYNLVLAPFLAFFSRKLYREVGRNWKGINLSYLFLLLAICCIPPTLHVRKQMLASMKNGEPVIFNQIPDIHIKNGVVSIDQRQPYFIHRADGKPVVIVDTTGSMNYIDNDSVWALLTETKLILRRDASHFNTFDLEMVSDLHINKEIVSGWFQKARASIAPLSYGIFLMLSYIFAMLTLLFVAIVGLIISAIMHRSLDFASSLRIASVAATPAIIFITISAALGHDVPGVIYLAITMVYLFIGIKSCSATQMEPDENGHVDLKALLHESEESAAEEAA